MKKRLSVFLIAMLINGLVFFTISQFGIVQAESAIAKPSVPEFTVQIVAHPYDVPTTHSIDPFTGQDVTHEGYHVENRSIVVRIKNQPFTPYQIQDSNGNEWTINLHYNIRIKGRFSEVWSDLYRPSDGLPRQDYESDYSVFSYTLGEGDAYTYLGTIMMTFPAGGQVDFQVEAMIGYVHREITIPVPGTGWIFSGETSDWSQTQTLVIPSSDTTPTPNESDGQADYTAAIIGAAIVVVVVVGLGLLVYLKKRSRRLEEIT